MLLFFCFQFDKISFCLRFFLLHSHPSTCHSGFHFHAHTRTLRGRACISPLSYISKSACITNRIFLFYDCANRWKNCVVSRYKLKIYACPHTINKYVFFYYWMRKCATNWKFTYFCFSKWEKINSQKICFFESIFFQVLILVRPIVDCFIFAGDCFLADNFLFSRF